MAQVNMLEAKTKLSKLVAEIESGKEREIVLARNGKPVARIVGLNFVAPRRLGLHDGEVPDLSLEEFNAMDEEIADLLINGPLFPRDDTIPVDGPAQRKRK